MARQPSSFWRLARAQQAEFRKSLRPEASAAFDEQGRKHGHLLAHGYEIENLYPEAGFPELAQRFFHEREIRWWKSSHCGDRRDAHCSTLPTRNLASSQVCCVNFLLPLASIPDALLVVLRCVDSDVQSIVTVTDGRGRTSTVEFEWVGWQASLEGGVLVRGALQTSVDALVVARTSTGRRAYLLEWKYSEAYRSPSDKGTETGGRTRSERYKERFENVRSSFNGTAPFDSFMFEPFYQIMRLHLLADSIVQNGVTPELQVDEASVVVVCPEANMAYRELVSRTPLARRFPGMATIQEVMRAVLKRPERFAMLSQEQIVAQLRSARLAPELEPWLEYHRHRYGW